MVLGALFRGLASALGLGGAQREEEEETSWSNARAQPGGPPRSPTKRARTAASRPPPPQQQPVLQDAPAGDGGVQGLDWAAAEREDSSGCAADGFIACDGEGGPRAVSSCSGGAAAAARASLQAPRPAAPAQPRRPKPGRRAK
jgi:hypothetical protein